MTTPEPGSAGAMPTPDHDDQFVTFSIADEMFAVPMAPVQEIIRVPAVARLPLAPPALDGLANLRGRVLPILNLRRLFALPERPGDDATRALVIDLGQALGFVVDRVASVVRVEDRQIEPATAIRSVVRAEYLTGVIRRPMSDGGVQLLLVLDFERLVREQFELLRRREQAAGRVASAGTAGDGEPPVAAAVAEDRRVVSFTVCAQEYGIDIADVQEIVQPPLSVTALPNVPAHMVGVMSLRERLLPLVSLRSLFGLGAAAADEQHRIVVVALPGGAQVGLVTDAVKEVLSVPAAATEPVPGVLARDRSLQAFESICRLDGGRRLVSIIATDRLLGLDAIRGAVAAADAGGTPASTVEDAMPTDRTATRDTDDDLQAVVFRLGDEEFGVPIMSVQEIVRVPDSLTRVPRTPAFVEGVINLRGTVLPVIDQRARLGLGTVARNDRQRIMVYTLGGVRTGFIVDAVAEVLRIPRTAIEPAPALGAEQARLITRVAKLDGDRRLVMLIEPDQLLAGAEAKALDALAAEPAAEAPPLARAA